MNYVWFVIARVWQSIPVLLGISVIAFLAVQLVPGDPVQIMLHGRGSPAQVAELRAELGLDRPLLEQYVDFVVGALTGDLGTSIIQRAPVASIIGERLAASSLLLTYATVLSVLIAIPLAIVAALRLDRPVDQVIRLVGVLGFAMPPFWIAVILMYFFGLKLGWFPIAGFGETFVAHLWHLTMPAVTVALFLAPILIQSLRAAMIEAMVADHVEVARAKGLSRRRVLIKHVLRNAVIPVITVLAVNIGWLLSGAVIVEYVFSLPGLGSLLVRSVSYRDYPVIQGLALVFGMIVLVVNLLADLGYMLADQRVARQP
ncbi:MAG: ABC transporter permease [Pseudomonadota bacterium]